jgi:transporter family protein
MTVGIIQGHPAHYEGAGRMKAVFLGWPFWAFASAVFAALTAIFAKIGVAEINSDLATLLRTLVVVVLLIALVGATGQMQALDRISPRTYLFLALSGLGTGASWLCYFRALQLGPAARVAPIDKLSVIFVALFGTLFLSEKLSGTNWFGVVLIAVGAILVAWR